MCRFSFCLLSVVLLSITSGCATGIAGGEKVLKFHADDDESFANAPKTGKYIVAYRQAGSGELWEARGTERTIKKGDELGFTHDDMDHLVAIAGDHEKKLGQMPIIAQYACWYRLPDDYKRNPQLMKNVVKGVKMAAAGAFIGGVAISEAEWDPFDSDDWTDRSKKDGHKNHR
jgi:hypothetical protein